MIDPIGHSSRSVYLRRRALAIAGSVLGVVALIWLIGALIGPDADNQQVQGAAAQMPVSTPPSTAPESPSSSSSSAAPSSVETSSATVSPTPPPAPPPPPPDPNLPCGDAVIAVTAEAGAPSYPVGTRPLLRLVVTNTGPVPCTRDVGHELRELLITTTDGVTRLWSSNDCYSPKGPEPTIMQAGQRLQFDVTWAGRTSAPGCPTKRVTVQAGTYSVTPRLGTLVGQPLPLVITPR